MSNNSSVNELCPLLNWYKKKAGQVGIGVYYGFTPFYLIIGVLAHALCLKAFLKQAKKEQAFIYQVMESVSRLCEILFRSAYVATAKWLTGKYLGEGAHWWLSCYNCLWFTAIIPITTMNAFFTASQLLSIFVLYNRILALAKPFEYKNMNHKRNQIFVAFFCFSIGFSTSAFQYIEYKVINFDETRTLFMYTTDTTYENSITFEVLNQTRNFVRGIGLLALYIGNVTLIWLFRKHRSQIKTHLQYRQSSEKEKDDAETTLTILCLCQSFFMTISMTAMITLYFVWAIKPSISNCEAILINPIHDGVIEFTDLRVCDFFLACFISRNFRKMIFNGVPIFNRLV